MAPFTIVALRPDQYPPSVDLEAQVQPMVEPIRLRFVGAVLENKSEIASRNMLGNVEQLNHIFANRAKRGRPEGTHFTQQVPARQLFPPTMPTIYTVEDEQLVTNNVLTPPLPNERDLTPLLSLLENARDFQHIVESHIAKRVRKGDVMPDEIPKEEQGYRDRAHRNLGRSEHVSILRRIGNMSTLTTLTLDTQNDETYLTYRIGQSETHVFDSEARELEQRLQKQKE